MYEVEHYSFCVLFWGMLIVLVVETMILDAPKEYVIPIFIVFMTGAIVSVICYYKKGIWDGKTSKPSYGASFRYSLFFTVLFTIIFAAIKAYKYPDFIKNGGLSYIGMSVMFLITLYILIYSKWLLLCWFTKKKQAK